MRSPFTGHPSSVIITTGTLRHATSSDIIIAMDRATVMQDVIMQAPAGDRIIHVQGMIMQEQAGDKTIRVRGKTIIVTRGLIQTLQGITITKALAGGKTILAPVIMIMQEQAGDKIIPGIITIITTV
jgi:hypothetical protein